jgi:3-isopropylmalate dehydrogenase
MRNHNIAVIPGDGIGPEVIDATRRVLSAAAEAFEFALDSTDYDLGAQHYLKTGDLWTDDLSDKLKRHDAILFGAMGDPAVAPGILERGIILQMRLNFRQAVNLRPVRLYPGIESPIRNLTPDDCDMVIVRENTEGAYVDQGTMIHAGTRDAVAVQNSINTRQGIQRVVDYSFRLAARRRRRLTLCHKKNILLAAGSLWQDTVDELSKKYPDVEVDYVHVDAMCFHLPTTPERFDVVVTDNLFGDIITDLGAVIQGGLGVAASANLNTDGSAPSMFEAIHGSAPDIAGRGWANPVGAILSASLCLATLGETDAAKAIEAAAVAVLAALPGVSGPAMKLCTQEIGERIAEEVSERARNSPPIPESLLDHLADLREPDGTS